MMPVLEKCIQLIFNICPKSFYFQKKLLAQRYVQRMTFLVGMMIVSAFFGYVTVMKIA
jgi:hypothetical protein